MSHILPADHPLGACWSVDIRAPVARRKEAAKVLGFSIGQKVVFQGKNTKVVMLNPADLEVGVAWKGATAGMVWADRSELT